MAERPPGMALSWRHALRRLRRATRAGELRILALAIVVAVAASSAVGLFSEWDPLESTCRHASLSIL